MITKDNFKTVLKYLGFIEQNDIYIKKFNELDYELKVDFKNNELIYPENKDFTVNERQTCNFKQAENFVVFECVNRLLSQGYHPKHIELEPKWQVGHGASGGRADILVKDNDGKALLIIECKTAGREFDNAWKTTQHKPTQLFSYVQQTRSTKFIALYASDFIDSKVVSNYYLINVTDNEDLIFSNPKLKSYKEATTVEEIYQVWSETYEKDYNTLGIFENNKAYDIGKLKFSITDLQPVSSKDIQEKYNKFATILRKYNVSGRENAFDKLVNLFLCKVVDEHQNKDELKFYWKGKAYDNPFDFQDRLQQLYKDGMKEFLGEDITYIDNNQIDDIFKLYDLETIKKDIKSVLTELKFFTNNDFAFIDVHNEKLFYQNFAVLLDIARLIQDINLTSSDENQFLGDMFEGFLDQGVKQSEGQFFTPMPIVKFIINSLPNKDKPKVIDYACGAGHFLNEYYASNNESKIIGIEKEYRLSKVAKVSSFMYGSNMNIIYNDALSSNEKIKNDDFDVLIANPPYSVKGFLETLSNDEREQFELIKTIEEKSYTANNAIECFFIERAKQLLSKDAVAGIIVPSSILNKGSQNITTNKGNVYVATREIILKYFDIVAIAEFGSGTFGKTGTNTVTLFLKRKCDKQNLADTFEELANKIFDCNLEFEKTLTDKDMLQKYCGYLEIDFDTYKTILCDTLDEKIFEFDIFKEYKTEFEKLTETKNRKKKTYYKKLDSKEQAQIEQKELLKYIKLIEKDKFYYYCLAYKNSTEVVIVKAPSNNNENKKFLGYEWSSAKGNEGIHYITKSSITVDDENLEEEDKRILENLQGLKDINTPLYNPNDSDDITKINKIIKDNFDGVKTKIPENLEKFVRRAKVVDMLDFSRVDFTKALSLNPSKKVEIESKYPLEKIDLITSGKIESGSRPKGGVGNIDSGAFSLGGEHIHATSGYLILDTPKYVPLSFFEKAERGIVQKNDILICKDGALTGKVALVKNEFNNIKAMINEHLFILRCDNLNTQLYLFNILYSGSGQELLKANITGSAQGGLNSTNLKNMKIPLPPLDIQEKIVSECQKIDDEVQKAENLIILLNQEIEKEIINKDSNINKIPLSKISKSITSGLTPLRTNNNFWNDGTIAWLKTEQLGEKYIYDTNEKISTVALEQTSIKINPKNTLSIAMYGEGRTRGSVSILKEEMTTNQACCNVFLDEEKANYEYVYYYLKTQYENLRSLASGVRHNLNTGHIKNYLIPLPSLEEQKQIVLKIEELENKINEAKRITESSKDKKEEILKKYL